MLQEPVGDDINPRFYRNMNEGSVYLLAECCFKLNDLATGEAALTHDTEISTRGFSESCPLIVAANSGDGSIVESKSNKKMAKKCNKIPNGAAGIYLLATFLHKSPARKADAILCYRMCLELDPTLFLAYTALADLGYTSSSAASSENHLCCLTSCEIFGSTDAAWLSNSHQNDRGDHSHASPPLRPAPATVSSQNDGNKFNNKFEDESINNIQTQIQFQVTGASLPPDESHSRAAPHGSMFATPNLTPIERQMIHLQTPVNRAKKVAQRELYDSSGGLGDSFLHASGGSVSMNVTRNMDSRFMNTVNTMNTMNTSGGGSVSAIMKRGGKRGGGGNRLSFGSTMERSTGGGVLGNIFSPTEGMPMPPPPPPDSNGNNDNNEIGRAHV